MNYFLLKSDGNCSFSPLFLPPVRVAVGRLLQIHYSKCFVFIFRQHEIWTAPADMKRQSILLITNQLSKDFLSFVDMFFCHLFSSTHLVESKVELAFSLTPPLPFVQQFTAHVGMESNRGEVLSEYLILTTGRLSKQRLSVWVFSWFAICSLATRCR